MSCFNLLFLGVTGWEASCRSGVTTGEGCGEFLCCKDSIPGYYVFFYKAYSDPMTEVNVSVKEEKKKVVFTFFLFFK